MPRPTRDPNRHRQGAALLVTALIMVAVGMLAFTAIRHSEQESTGGARSRATTRSLYAADAGLQLARSRLRESPPNLTSFDIDLAEGANVQSRTRTDGSPQDLNQVGIGAPAEGYALNVGAGASYVNRVYLVAVTSTSGGSTAELEAKLNRTEIEATSY